MIGMSARIECKADIGFGVRTLWILGPGGNGVSRGNDGVLVWGSCFLYFDDFLFIASLECLALWVAPGLGRFRCLRPLGISPW